MITEKTKAVLLLTSYFNSSEVKKYKPLTVNEYGYLACWLNQNSFTPTDLLNSTHFEKIFDVWDLAESHTNAKAVVGFSRLENTIANITYERVHELLNRGTSLSIALDKWQSAGIWIIDRQHPSYPLAIKKHLKHQSPALFFGVGNKELLSNSAIGFVGSRDCSNKDKEVTRNYVEEINKNGYQVVSGAAKGIDTESMIASIQNGSASVGVVADNLFRASASSTWRSAFRSNKLVLISPFYPEAGFSGANAMTRNKFIYLLSSSTIVMCSGESGGTWEGAKENLKKGWVPLFVSAHEKTLQSGNRKLLDGLPKTVLNAKKLTQENLHEVMFTERNAAKSTVEPKRSGLSLEQAKALDRKAPAEENQTELPLFESAEPPITPDGATQKNNPSSGLGALPGNQEDGRVNCLSYQRIKGQPLLDSFYQQLCVLIETQTKNLISEDTLIKHFPEFEIISKKALSSWLKYLVEQGLLLRPNSRKKEYSLPSRTE